MILNEIIERLPQLLSGVGVTIELMVSSLLVGLILAVLFTFLSETCGIVVRKIIDGYVFFIRGTPLLVQIFLIYYGSGQFEWLRHTPLWIILQEPFSCAIIAFALNTAGYTTALLRGAINSVPSGEVDACYALGMSRGVMYRHIIIPRAFRIMLPAYSNEVVMILKGTSLASTITLLDLMGVTNKIIAQTYETIEWLVVAGIIYLILNAIVVTLFKLLERHYYRYLQQ